MLADFVQIFLAEKCLIISEGIEWQAGGGRVIHINSICSPLRA